MTTLAEWQQRVNDIKASVQDVSLTKQQAEAYARKLYRFVRKGTFAGTVGITSGNRHSWVHSAALITVNPGNGLRSLLWDFSNALSANNARARLRMQLRLYKTAIARGWFMPHQAKAPKPKAKDGSRLSRLEDRIKRLKARLARWDSRQRRAANAIKSLTRKLKAAERTRIPAATADVFEPHATTGAAA